MALPVLGGVPSPGHWLFSTVLGVGSCPRPRAVLGARQSRWRRSRGTRQAPQPESLCPAAKGTRAASHHLHPHRLLPPAFTSPFRGTASSSAPTCCPQRTGGAGRAPLLSLVAAIPGAQRSQSPFADLSSNIVRDIRGLVLASGSSTFWFPFLTTFWL